ncbi:MULTISPECIES: DUF3098 domain-containing protein [unclassified Porphyromonas]|uniref:DUF3098 domain-containing protein n=1 Tax=unclassified Porphyromonas TaxID=2645799 RepID=UPI00052C3A6C|nr:MULTISPECIES: DUF3098 domain-containing protein [unclassified Porphyromonas]KGN82300.1 membrane protein [Porphyromonas sp. COT-290 OH860]KGO00148.1 membrane protein [Porphyromonas sp. COT-290 OH3588]
MTYSKYNYLLVALSVAIIIVGFALMSGGGSTDPETFNPEIFSTRRIVVAPIVCLSGFLLMIYAILASPKRK